MNRLKALAAALAFATTSTIAWATAALPPGVAERTTYYSDHTLSTEVGAYQINCDGTDDFWGVVSESHHRDRKLLKSAAIATADARG